jgi:hypothetical protein
LSFRKQGNHGRPYDAGVRRWFVLALILLLPLRGWVGDAMAADMLQQRIVAAASASAAPAAGQAVQAVAAAPEASGHHDCMGHAVPAKAQPAPHHDAAAPDPDCPTCASCQVCSAVALALPAVTVAGTPFFPPRPQGASADPASAERARALKPPIS